MTIKVVIVDDHQLFIDGIKAILRTDLSIEVVGQAHNGFELLKHLEIAPIPDIVMMDIRMPMMDGIVTTRILHKQFPAIAVLALSMNYQIEDVNDMMQAGAMGYMVKNAGKDEMIKALYALHNKKEYISEDLRYKIDSQITHQEKSSLKPLTRRESEILSLIAKGKTSSQIATILSISKLTVDTHRKNILKKLGIHSVAGLMKYALESHLN